MNCITADGNAVNESLDLLKTRKQKKKNLNLSADFRILREKI